MSQFAFNPDTPIALQAHNLGVTLRHSFTTDKATTPIIDVSGSSFGYIVIPTGATTMSVYFCLNPFLANSTLVRAGANWNPVANVTTPATLFENVAVTAGQAYDISLLIESGNLLRITFDVAADSTLVLRRR